MRYKATYIFKLLFSKNFVNHNISTNWYIILLELNQMENNEF